MIEWAEWDKFNSFNSWKGLLYADWYKGIAEGKIFPPIEASIDPIHACNLDCKHCNAVRYRRENPQKMTDEHLFNLIDFLSEWGVKANCFGGGGEPTMHPGLSSALLYSKAKGMESSLSTNGTIMSDKLADAIIETCRWIGISVDAASGGTYEELKGTNLFGKVLDNIKKLVKLNEKDKSCDINYKFLISPINQHEIYEACSIARDLGVRDFQARPMDYNHQGMGELRGVFGEFDMTSIRTQLEACHSFSNPDFHVYTPVHKFDEDFHGTSKRFSHCYASGLIIQLCADGNVYYCIDQRHNEDLVLGTHYPEPINILRFWGKARHLNLIQGDTSSKCKTRCTLGPYCEQCERLFINKDDPMCWGFA